MLGGLESVSPTDLAGSSAFLAQWYPRQEDAGLALDVGAGIGRVSSGLLLQHFKSVSLLESNEAFLAEAMKKLPSDRVCQTFPIRFGDWTRSLMNTNVVFDLVWIQWVIIYASDDELVSFLQEAKSALRPGTGMIGLKDNILSQTRGRLGNSGLFDEEDHSVCRTAEHLEALFAKAGLTMVDKREQDGMPPGLFPVYMYMFK
jgi:protein N-terminal methyltransferase